jgi:hypothetical protein
MPTDLEAKYAERDALYSWLETLEREGASAESVRLVQAQLDRVLEEIPRLSVGQPCGFDVPASLSHSRKRSLR